MVRHARCGAIGLHQLGMLYVREEDILRIPAAARVASRTKIELVVEEVMWLRSQLHFNDRSA